jgi:PAS domain S-box-containing protein
MAPSVRLLLVEPDESDRRLVRQALRARGSRVHVVEAPGLPELAACLGAGHFDAGLIDVDGWPRPFDAFDRAHALAPDLPLIILSRTDVAEAAARRGADGFVAKTGQGLARLRAVVSSALARAAERRPRQALRQQAQASEQRYRLLFEKNQDALVLCDVRGRILEMNQSARRLVDRPAAELIGTPLTSWLEPATRVSLADLTAPLRTALREPRVPIELDVSRLTLDDEPMCLVVLRDLRREERAAQLMRRFEIAQSQLTTRLEELTRLERAGEHTQLRQPLAGLLDTFCTAIHDSLGWERVVFWLRDDQSPMLRVLATHGAPPDDAIPIDLNARAWRKSEHRIGRSYFIPGNGAAAPGWQPGDLLVVPVEIGGELVGAIQADLPASGQRPLPDDLISLELFAQQAAVAIENALLYERASLRLQQRTEQMTALTAMSAAADQGSLPALLEQVLDQVLGVVDMKAGAIALLEPATGELRPQVQRGLSDALWGAAGRAPVRIGEGIGGRALAAGHPIVVTDVANDPRVPYRDFMLQDGIRTAIGVGLIGRNPVGTLVLYAHSVRQPAAETLEWLSVAGRQIALSIENSRLIESMRRRQQMAEAVREVNSALASTLELDAVLAAILDQIGRVVRYDAASILLIDRDVLRVIATRGPGDPPAMLGYAYTRDERHPAWQAILKRQAQVVADVAQVAAWDDETTPSGARAWIGAPLVVRNEVIGVLTLEHRQPDFYSDEDGRNTSLIAQQAAVAIDNARRFQSERERTERLALLNDLGRELIVSLDRDTVVSLVADHLAGRFGYSQVDVFLVDPASNEVVLGMHAGADLQVADAASRYRLPLGAGIVGYAASTGRTYVSGDVSVDPRYVKNPLGRNMRSEIAVPLHIEERVVGVVNVESDRLDAFDADDVAMLETFANQISAALSIAELYHETQQRAGNLSTLFAASQEFSSSLDSDQVLGRLAQWLVGAVDATSARVHVWDLASGVGRLLAQYVGARASVAERQAMVGAEWRLDDTPELVAVMKAREALTCAADEAIDLSLRERLRQHGVTSALYLPLIVRERLIGCVEAWETGHTRVWQPEEAHLCQTIANVAASAIDNARLFEGERQRRAVAETLRELAAVVSSSLELQPILEALLERAAGLLPYDSASVMIRERGVLEVAASRGLPGPLADKAIRLPEDRLSPAMLGSHQAMIIADVRAEPDWMVVPGTEYIRSWLGVPLVAQGRVIGMLTFDSRLPGRYRREHADIAEMIAPHAAVAIQNARLFQETSQRLAELETLQSVSLEMIQSLDPMRVARAVADGALRLLKATAVHLFSYDAHADALQVVAKSAAPGFEAVGQPTPRREGLTMQVAHTGQAVVINDPQNDPLFAPLTQAWPWTVTSAIAGLPLQVRGRVLGVMNVLFHVPHLIDDNEVRVLRLLADQAATALENARLFENEQKRRVAADVLREMSMVLTSTLNLNEVFERLFDQLARVIPYTSASALLLADTDQLRIIAGRGFQAPEQVIGTLLELGDETPSARVIRSRAPLILDDVLRLPAWQALPGMPEVRAWMGAPLIVRDEIIGTLSVDHAQPGIYTQEQAELFGVIANQAAAAITNARLYEALTEYATSLETRVAERTAEIRREQERTITILNSVADAVLVTDLAGAIVLTNPTAEMLLHEDEQSEASGQLRRWLPELSPNRGAPKIDVGKRTWQAAVAHIREDDRVVGNVIVLRDITRLEEVDRLKTQFVSNVSHELRTPLTNVKLYLGLFQKGKPEKREQYLSTLQNEVSRLERLITDLLDLSRLERSRHSVAHVPIDLAEVLRHVLATLEPQAEAKRQTLRLELVEPVLTLPADRNQMIQVFVNLAANAINYTPPGGVVTLRASIVERDGRAWVVVETRDTGVGIPAEERDRIFDRFFRGRAEQFEVRGTGLGLSIVKEIIDQHSGHIIVESQVGEGSTFTVWLPMS